MEQSYLIGLDFGSDSVRAVLVDAAGKELATAVHPYARWAEGRWCDPANNRFRQHPLDYLEGMETVVKKVLAGADAAKVRGIGVDTTGSTPCAVGADGQPLALTPEFADDPDAMFVLWKDHTAVAEAEEINRAAKTWGPTDYTMYEGGIYSSEWYWSKALHVLRANAKVRAAAHAFVEHCDWVTAVLAGAPVKPSRCAAGHKAMWHASWGGLPPEGFFAAIDPLLAPLRRRLGPETFTADVPVGGLCPEWAARLGLPAGVAVAGGAFDCHMGAVGAGIKPGQLVKVIGTSTCDIMVAPAIDKCVRGICGQVDGSVIPGMVGLEAGQSAFGDVYAWFKRFLAWGGGKVELADLEKAARELPDGPTMALDWLNGRRTPDADQNLTGAIFGLNLGTTPPMVYRALVESTAFGARAIADRFAEEGVRVESVAAIGGIARKSPWGMQVLADVLGLPIRVCASDQTCALGAAMFGAVAGGVFPNVNAAMAAMAPGVDAEYQPGRDCGARYAKYRRLAAAMEKESRNV